MLHLLDHRSAVMLGMPDTALCVCLHTTRTVIHFYWSLQTDCPVSDWVFTDPHAWVPILNTIHKSSQPYLQNAQSQAQCYAMSIMTKVLCHEHFDKGSSQFCTLCVMQLLTLVSPGRNAVHDCRQCGFSWGCSS